MVEVYTPLIDRATNQPVLDENGQPKLALMANKLQAGCVTLVSPGMVVKTVTDRVKFAQRGQLEFLLTSHPLDCPVCDKGGECPLQNLTMEWGPGNSRYDYEDKQHFVKPIPLGDLIHLDRERCILCARCVRFQDEIAGDPVLGFDNRGRSWEIISKSDPPFDSKFSGNTTDICPVGALTTSDFRFKARVWELRSVPSICPHCPVGCNISLDMRYDNLMRVMPRENDYVNEIWTCDKGRFGMRFFEQKERIKTPLIKRNNKWVEASWDEALSFVADKLTLISASAGAEALAGLAGPKLPNEDLYLFQKLFREVLGSGNVDHRAGLANEPALDDLMPQLGVGQGTNLMTLGKGTSVLVIGADPEEEAPIYVLRLHGILNRGGEVTVVNPYPTKLDRLATRSLHPRPGTGPQLVLALISAIVAQNLQNDEFIAARLRNVEDLRQALGRFPMAQLIEATGIAEDAIRALASSFANAENGIIIYGRTALSIGPALLQAIANLALITGKAGKPNNGLIALTSDGNTRGALDMGVRPDKAAGGAAVAQPGLSAREMWGAAVEGRVRGMYIAGLNPARGNPAVAQALEALEFLVVQDLFLTETAQLADVVLPASSLAEREGTFTNAERRVQRFRQARRVEGTRPDWQIFQGVAQGIREIVPAETSAAPSSKRSARTRAAAGGTAATAVAAPLIWDYVTASDVADEISQVVAGYAGTSYTSLDLTRKSWGRQPNEAFYYDGTSYENTEGVGVQLAALADSAANKFTLTFREPDSQAADERYPIALMTAPRAYSGGEWARGSKLQSHTPPAHIILSLADARRLGVGMGEKVQISSAGGAIELPAQVDAGLAEGLALLPLVAGAEAPGLLAGGITRVAASKAE
jgi:NADH-quinone oxidoreductase subunit G